MERERGRKYVKGERGKMKEEGRSGWKGERRSTGER